MLSSGIVRRRLALLLALLVTCGLLAAQRLVPQAPPPEPPPGEGEPTGEQLPTPTPPMGPLTSTPATISIAGRDLAG